MPGHRDLDFTPILTHYLFLVTSVLAFVGWITAFIGQAAFEAQVNIGGLGIGPAAGTQWFGIFLHAAVIGGVLYTLATDAIALNRLQISVFGAISIVYAVQGAHGGLYSPLASGKAMGAGYLILSFVFILWTLYFSAEEGSITLDVLNSLGTGGLTGPGRRRTVVGGQGIARSASVNMNGSGIGGGYANPSGGYGSPTSAAVPYGGGPYGGGGLGVGGGKEEITMRSQHSLSSPAKGIDARSIGAASARDDNLDGRSKSPQLGANPVANLSGNVGGFAPPSTGPPGAELATGAPLAMPSPGHTNNTGADSETFHYRAKALYSYKASDEDPTELSFNKGDILDIVDNSGKWWHARKADGTSGIAPSNYLSII